MLFSQSVSSASISNVCRGIRAFQILAEFEYESGVSPAMGLSSGYQAAAPRITKPSVRQPTIFREFRVPDSVARRIVSGNPGIRDSDPGQATARRRVSGHLRRTPRSSRAGGTVAEALDIARDVGRKLIEARREREGVPNLPTTSERRDYTIVIAA